MRAVISQEELASVIKGWHEEWSKSPNQFLIGEAYRQTSSEDYAAQGASHLFPRLLAFGSNKEESNQ